MNYYKKITTSPRSVQGKNFQPFVLKGTTGIRPHNSVVQEGGKQNKPMRQARKSCPSIRAKKFLEDLNTSNNKQKVIGN